MSEFVGVPIHHKLTLSLAEAVLGLEFLASDGSAAIKDGTLTAQVIGRGAPREAH